jgi:DNA-binding Lrp family transcriptional regulator
MARKEVMNIKKRWGLYYGEPYKLDEFDRKILLELQDNSRQSLQDLHLKIKLSRDAIRHRIDKMIKSDIILGFTITLNHPKVGFPIISYVLIALENVKPEAEERFIKYLRNSQKIIYAASLIGKWDYVLYVAARNPGDFAEILRDLRTNFPDLIKDYETFTVLEEFKYEEVNTAI